MRKSIGTIQIFCSVSQKEIVQVKTWLIPSLMRQKGVGKIILYLINYSGEGRVYKGSKNIGKVSVKEIDNSRPRGFGEAFNYLFNIVKPRDCFLIVNPDIYLHEICIGEMVQKMLRSRDIGIVEARQLPFEHPKEFNKKTKETPWATGSCMLVNSEFFKEVGGFDKNFWMYCEDVDLSWQAWLKDYRVLHNPDAIAYHFTGLYFEYNDYQYYLEHFWSARNFIYLMYKYWRKRGEKKAIKIFLKTRFPEYFKKEVLESYKELKEKSTIPMLKERQKLNSLKDKIKVLGFNRYHLINK
ncbi:MAG: hypothetical protein GTN40_00210 [Candidatus Aenigmarchaeota archaeon]|nr:hypothetical protein [Candidatus Aenigmarchaeota archaeon]